MDVYNRMTDSDPNRCYRWRRAVVDGALDRWRAAQHRIIYTASLRSRRRSQRAPAPAPMRPAPAALC
eukprot:2501460-Heterocapsa_arctica.AAC.1